MRSSLALHARAAFALASACAVAFAADDALTRFYSWPPAPDYPHVNAGEYWDWQPTRASSGPALVDLRPLNETTAGQSGWVRREGDRIVLGDGRPVRFWAVNTTGNAPLPALTQLADDLARRGVNLVRIHGGASKTLLDLRGDRLDAVNRAVIDQMHRAVVAARQAGIYTFVSNSLFIIELKVKAAYGLEGYTQAWLDAHPNEHVPFGLVFLNDRLRSAFKGWLREFVTAPNPYDEKRTPLARDRAVAVIEILNEDNLFFYTFKPATWPPEQRVLAGRKFFAWLAARHAQPGESPAAAVRRVHATWDAPFPEDDLAAGTLALAPAGSLGPGPKFAARYAAQLAFLGDTQRDFHREMTALLRECGFGGLVSPSNWNTAYPEVLLDLEHETYRQGDIIDRHAYFAPAVAQDKLKFRVSAGDTYVGLSSLVQPALSPTNVRQSTGYPSALSEFMWVSHNPAVAEGPLLAASYFSLTDFDLPVWFALGTSLWSEQLGKWTVGRPGVLGQFPGAALLYRRGDVATAPVVVCEGRTLETIYRREPARSLAPRGFDAIRDDPAKRPRDAATSTDRLAMMVGRVEHTLETDDDTIDPRLAQHIDRAHGRVTSITGELVTDWYRGLFTVNTPRAQGAAGFLRAAGRIDLGDVVLESQNRFGALVAISLDGQPLAHSEKILIQVGALDRLSGFRSELTPVSWQGRTLAGERIAALGRPPWQVEKTAARLTLKGAAARLVAATALDENLRALSPLTATFASADLVVPLPSDSLYTLIQLQRRP